MARKKKPSQAPESHRTGAEVGKVEEVRQQTAQEQENKDKISRRSKFLFWFTLVMLLVIFGGRWVVAIMNGYYESFVELGSSVTEALDNMEGLTIEDSDSWTAVFEDRQEWNLFTGARLADQVTVTAQDGAQLHGYYYNEDSDVTVIYVPRFGQDGTAEFLPGTWLNQETGCNLLLIDPRGHGDSEGQYFSYGVYEQYDLVTWIAWAEEHTDTEQFILWGEATGANTILFAASSGILPDSVAFAVAESPYASLHQMATRNLWKWYTVPAQPFLLAIELRLAASDAGYTIQDTNLGKRLGETTQTLPVIFLESGEDEYILPEWTQAVYDAYSGEKELVSGADAHGTVYSVCDAEVQASLARWIDDCLK